jgi:hypothetical protein
MSGAIITATLIGDDTARAGDIFSRGRSPVFGLCRGLLAAGADPDACLECYRGTTLALVVKSIGRGAELTVKERDRGGLEIARWEPFPSSPVKPRIRQNVTELGVQRSDDELGISWWNALAEKERRNWMRKAGDTGVARDAWLAFKAERQARPDRPDHDRNRILGE